jgi:hypothetical protein
VAKYSKTPRSYKWACKLLTTLGRLPILLDKFHFCTMSTDTLLSCYSQFWGAKLLVNGFSSVLSYINHGNYGCQ